MTSTGVNVLRYSALGAGLFYGLYRQANLTAQYKLKQIEREYQHNQELVAKAKQAYAKKNNPDEKSTGDNIISDPDDKNFDLEAYLYKIAGESQSATK